MFVYLCQHVACAYLLVVSGCMVICSTLCVCLLFCHCKIRFSLSYCTTVALLAFRSLRVYILFTSKSQNSLTHKHTHILIFFSHTEGKATNLIKMYYGQVTSFINVSFLSQIVLISFTQTHIHRFTCCCFTWRLSPLLYDLWESTGALTGVINRSQKNQSVKSKCQNTGCIYTQGE